MTTAVQNHIHLSSTVDVSGEKAPNIKWPIHDRKQIPIVFANLRRSKRGNARQNILNTVGVPIQIFNWQYQIRVAASGSDSVDTRLAYLLAMQGKLVYLVDSIHCVDTEDHTSFIQSMYLDLPDGLKTDHYGLQFYYVTVNLESAAI